MNGVIDHTPTQMSSLSTYDQSVDIPFHMAALAYTIQTYAMALDEALEGLLAAQQALQEVQVPTMLARTQRQHVEQGADICEALIASVQEQLMPMSDELHALLGQWAEHRASLSSLS